MSFVEHAQRVALLLGRASTVAAPRVRVVSLEQSGLVPASCVAIAEALKVNEVLTHLDLENNRIGDEGAKAIGEALRVNGVLNHIDLSSNNIDALGTRRLLLRHGRDRVSGRDRVRIESLDRIDEPDVCCSVC